MKRKLRGKVDPIERQIEVTLRPGEFIHDRACISFVSGLEKVAADIGKVAAMEPAHVFAHARLAGVNAEFEEFVDARRPPKRVLAAHLPDQPPDIHRHRGRPVWPRQTLQAQNSRNPLRCHATTVFGLTTHRAERHSSQTAQNQAHRNRSNRLSFGLFTECCSTPSWWRRAMISSCNAARVRKALRLQSTAAKL